MARLKAPVGGCAIRMYRNILGDCFLLAFGAGRRTQKYILIDCGVLLGTDRAEEVMLEVARDIRQATGDHLDALVITHEHWDHISGFEYAKSEFEQIDVEQVWFAWTENPGNPLARELKERRRAAFQGLQTALQNAASAPQQFSQRIESVSAFFGPRVFGARAKTEDIMEWIKQRWPNHRYCDPGGEPLHIDGLPDVGFYVLGPPADASYIRKSRPSKRGDQVYLDDVASGELGLYLAALSSSSSALRREGGFTPFDEAYQRDPNHPDVTTMYDRYQAEGWRQIASDWTGAAGELALKLDAHTNNTSLVLAVELARKDKVLLFPGDAQVGNWLYWDKVKWSGEAEKVTAQDLLARTVLYKVGHHGSHNATLREKGLERMNNEELAAMIPVDRAMAKRMRWRMPHKPLHERLMEKTLGRLVLSDAGLPQADGDAAVEAFLKQCTGNDLYIDYAVQPWKQS